MRNAYGVYDMSGYNFENVASYVNNGRNYLGTYGGTDSWRFIWSRK